MKTPLHQPLGDGAAFLFSPASYSSSRFPAAVYAEYAPKFSAAPDHARSSGGRHSGTSRCPALHGSGIGPVRSGVTAPTACPISPVPPTYVSA